jgi:hypothetical protein
MLCSVFFFISSFILSVCLLCLVTLSCVSFILFAVYEMHTTVCFNLPVTVAENFTDTLDIIAWS